MIYDVIIIGAGASGLFAGMNLDKNLNKLILEKTDKPGTKVLLSGGERANVSNININPEKDYFSQNKKYLLSIFSKFNQRDTISFFSSLGINVVEEDRGRLILESGDSKELLDILVKGVRDNNCEIRYENDVVKINIDTKSESPHPNPLPKGEGTSYKKDKECSLPLPLGEGIQGGGQENQIFQITTTSQKKYQTKNIIISTGGKSFFHTGTTGEGFNLAEKLGLNVITPYRTLCGMSTKMDLSSISGTSCNVDLELKDKNNKKIIYTESGPILFTHFGVSGPIIYNTSNAVGEYLNSLKLEETQFEKYILENLSIDLKFDLENTPKKIIKFFNLSEQEELINLELQNWRSWKEAKATGGGIDTLELDNHLQSKKYKGLYFVGEVVDVTGKTGGYNLQWAWSSGFVASKNIS